MKCVFEFKCADKHITERFIDSGIRKVDCEICGKESKRIISVPRLLRMDGAPIDIMSDSWAKKREKNAKRAREHGDW